MTVQEHQVCLLLGSNIQPEKNLALGMDLLRSKVIIVKVSPTWETQAVGSLGPDFLNLAMLVTTSLDARMFSEQIIRPIELKLGRVRSTDRNAPRTIDIDIIIFDDQLLDPNLWLFAHRAVPVAALLPEFRSEQGDLLMETASRLTQTTRIRLKPDPLISPIE